MIIRPFCAWRPKQGLAAQVSALPYDVMNTEEAREMVKGNPLSFLHVDKAEIDLDPSLSPYSPAVYEKAKETLQKMKDEGVYVKEAKPCLYIYRLTLNGRSQTGLVACTSVDEYLSEKIKKHELTREDKEQDRIKHLDYCNAHTGPIFLTYRAKAEISAILEKQIQKKPVEDFVAEDFGVSVQNTIWIIEEPEAIDSLVTQFEALENFYIADGHHRNASAVKVALQRRQAAGNETAEDGEYNQYLSVIFPDNQLEILDYNRIVKDLNGLSVDEFIAKLEVIFDVEKKESPYKPESLHSFGMYVAGSWYKLSCKDHVISSDPIKSLDVSILQNEVLDPILNIKDLRTDKRIDFVGGMRGLQELSMRVDQTTESEAVAFALYPTQLSQLMEIADVGGIMPPKSTWFEPKLRSGLFIHDLT